MDEKEIGYHCGKCECNPLSKSRTTTQPEKQVWFTKINPNAYLPEYKSAAAACADLYLPESIILPPQSISKIGFGLIARIDINYHLEIYIRSSVARSGIILANSVGIIDSDYCGPEDELGLLLYNTNDYDYYLNAGMRIAQCKIVPNIRFPIMEVTNEALAERSRGGFGSTGK